MKDRPKPNLLAAALLGALSFTTTIGRAQGPLPSWNDGPAKQAIVQFVAKTTKAGSPDFVPPAERIATFDQDGTLWVEPPVYSQVMYCLDRVPAVVAAKPELKEVEPFKTVLSGDREAIAKLTMPELELRAQLLRKGLRPPANALLITPTLTYNLPHGWFAGYSDFDRTCDWQNGGDATIPLGLQAGKIFRIGKVPVSLSLEGAWLPVRPGGTPEWLVCLEFTVIYKTFKGRH
jgi:hypothetical protein